MINISKYLVLGLYVISPTFASEEQLLELFYAAKKHHKSFSRVQLIANSNEARSKELRAGLLPSISLEGTWFHGNKTLTTESGYDRIDNQQNLSLSQSLYRGGSGLLYFDFKKLLPKLAKSQEEEHALNFFFTLNREFFEFRRILTEEKNLKKQIESLKKRVKILRDRSKIGRSRKTDYLSTYAQLKRLESDLQLRTMEKTLATNRLKRLTGQEIQEYHSKINFSRFEGAPNLTNDKIFKRPEIQLLELKMEEQELFVANSKSDYRPQIDVEGNFYFNRRNFGRQDDWDIALTMTWNIWDFSQTSSRVQQEKIKLRSLSFQKQELENDLIEHWKSLSESFQLRKVRVSKLKEALDVANQNHRQHVKEFSSGLIDSVDLTRALDELLIAENRYNQVRYALAEQWYVMKAFAGELEL